jgi:hypothetical protein
MISGDSMNLDTAINNALKQLIHRPEYRAGICNFNDWLKANYKMQVQLIGRDQDQVRWPEGYKWEVVMLDDEGLATMFKLQYG